ncbi:hypothetical protein FDP41_000174 [Naegleria fowleri]|uniref:Uncharacterized protein n=1 Tax=Naegleria fowleri TaxID=5763 RepID=A0A6A5CIK5_NAEFO|nr:uncharacterized protein FDP41_000174 [Naegleria fowleri]KAF0985135.1 hypothetical protein FDP41_000174 [Naegleria fowleri]
MRKLISGLFVSPSPFPQKFSLEALNKLCDTLEQNKIINDTNAEIVVETLRSISELMVWGDKHNEKFWDLFLERNVFHSFFNVLSQPNAPNQVKKQLIQSISIMIQNMNNTNSMYFLLSNNHINELINHPLDFSDEELLAYYINFLKTISLKFDKSMIQFFFDSYNLRFPLYDQCIKFCNHSDSMIRIAVRTITLNTYSVKDPALHKYVTSGPYFSMLADSLIDQLSSLNYIIIKTRENKSSIRILEDYSADLLDHLFYLKDIINTNIERMDEKITESIVDFTLRKLIRDVMLSGEAITENSELQNEKKYGLLLETVLYCISQVYTIFNHKILIERLTGVIFSNDIGFEYSFYETILQQVDKENNNESLLLTALSTIYSIASNECKYFTKAEGELIIILKASPSHILSNYGIVRPNDLEELADDQKQKCYEFYSTLWRLVSERIPNRINTLHIIYRIFSHLWSDLSINNIAIAKQHFPAMKKTIASSREILLKLISESDIFEFMDNFQLEYTQYQRLNSLRPDAIISDIAVLINYEKDESSDSIFDQIPLQRSSSNIENSNRFSIHEFLLIYEFLSKSKILTQSILGREETISLGSIVQPKPEYLPEDEAVMVNRETIRCSITSPQSLPLPPVTQSSPKKVPRTPNGGGTPTKKDNREMRHIFFDNNFLYIVTVDINRVGFGIVEETIPLFSVQVKTNEQNKFSLRLVAEKKQALASPLILFDKKLVFDDFKIAKEVKAVIEKKLEECRQLKLSEFKKALNQ